MTTLHRTFTADSAALPSDFWRRAFPPVAEGTAPAEAETAISSLMSDSLPASTETLLAALHAIEPQLAVMPIQREILEVAEEIASLSDVIGIERSRLLFLVQTVVYMDRQWRASYLMSSAIERSLTFGFVYDHDGHQFAFDIVANSKSKAIARLACMANSACIGELAPVVSQPVPHGAYLQPDI